MAVDFLAKRDIIEAIIPIDAVAITRISGVGGAWSSYAILITAANMNTYFPGGFILCGAYVHEAFTLAGGDGIQAGFLNLEVASGAAGGEVPIAESHGMLELAPGMNDSITGMTGRTHWFEPILVPTNTRLAYRVSTPAAKAVNASAYLFGYDARYFGQPLKAVDELRYIRGLCSPTKGATVFPNLGGTAVTTHPTTAWLYGTAVAFDLDIAGGGTVAVTPLLITGLASYAVTISNRVQAKIGIGAAGSEQWMSKVGLALAVGYPGPLMDAYLPRPLYVKTGEAVSVQIAGSIANTVTNIALKGFALK